MRASTGKVQGENHLVFSLFVILVEYCDVHLIWSMDILEQVHRGVH
ncbi:hypothetical protein [uncultured Victivallis sp.]|nr:hypothetical protein [uncultured Victivallis sp.]